MRIALLEPLGVSNHYIQQLAEPLRQRGHEFVYFDTKTTNVNELIERSQGADVVMIANTPYPTEVVQASKSLKLLAVAFTGIDHVGLTACKEQGVSVCNCAGYSDVSVAELAIGLTIAVLRKIVMANERVRGGATSEGLAGQEIYGKTVGIVGTGRIGLQTAKLFKAFGARVLGYGRHENPLATEAGVEYIPDLDELLRQCDIVSLHLPATEQTKGLFNAQKFALMPKGSVFINCARGAIVDNEALAAALAQGQLGGAGIDVFDMEPPLATDYPLCTSDNTVLTPHVAFLTHESMLRRAQLEFDNVVAWLDGAAQNLCTF